MSDGSPERFLYVAGTSFTGSTLLSFLLNLHPQIVCVGECDPNFSNWPDPNQYPCSCGATLAECPFWTAVGAEMSDRGMRFDPEHWRTSFRPSSRIGRRLLAGDRPDALRAALGAHVPVIGSRVRSTARRNEALVASVRSVAAKPVFADASKDVSRARLLDHMTDLRPYVIHLVRDSLGFVASKKSRAEKNSRAARGAAIGNAARHWNRRGTQAEQLFEALPPERRLRVRYEDLCTDPEHEFARICEMLGLEQLPGPYEFLAGDHHIIGNRMRLSSSSEIVLDERWRSILTEEEAETVRQVTSRHRQAFGYPA
jgi:hypothetical protein